MFVAFGGALAGLQFVVLTLITDSGMIRGTARPGCLRSPNLVHFCAPCGVVSSATWHSVGPPAIAVACAGYAALCIPSWS